MRRVTGRGKVDGDRGWDENLDGMRWGWTGTGAGAGIGMEMRRVMGKGSGWG